MSNERTFPDEDCGPSSPFTSPTHGGSSAGAPTTESDSNIPCFTSSSDAKALSCGESTLPSIDEPKSLIEIVSADGYAARSTSLALRVTQAVEPSAVHALLREATAALGAENGMFLSFVRDDTHVSTCRFMLACDPEWCRRYLEADLIAHDPWITYAIHRSEPILATALTARCPAQQQAIDLAVQSGFASAVVVPAHAGAGYSRVSLLCLGSSTAGFFEGEGFGPLRVCARVLALELHDWWLGRIRRELIVKAHVTESDLELLRHEHHGHSSKRIAAELQVSECSINSRFQRINAKLGVANRRLAAKLAMECGLILD